MWGSHLFGGLGALIRRSPAGSEDSSDSFDIDVETAPGMLAAGDYEQHEVKTGNGKARIFVARRTMSSYFDEDEEYSPTIVAAARPSPVYSQHRAVADTPAGESPADLFINAIRKPARQITADAEPIIIRKERIAPSRNFEAEPVKAAVEEPVTIVPVEEPVIEIAVPVPDQTVSVVAEAEPVVSVAVPAPEMTVEEPVLEGLEIQASSVEHEIAHAEPSVAAEVAEEVVEAESVEAVVEQPAMEVEEITVAEPVEEVVESVPETPAILALAAPKTVMLALPPRLEIRSLPAATEVTEEPVQETEPVTVTATLLKKIEVEDLEPVGQESQIAEYANAVDSAEVSETSAEAMQEPVTADPLVGVSTAPALELENPDDVLLAFYPELREESDEFNCTSMEIHKGFPEDKLDRTECTFKLKIRRVYPTYNGYMRHIANH